MRTLVLGLVLLAGQTEPISPKDTWPQWRGPTHDSESPTPNLPTHWSKTENVVWKTPLPGWGNSTPAIWKDAVFVTTQDQERLLLLRLDRQTGKVVWERKVGKGQIITKAVKYGFHAENNMASPSPVT